MTNSPSVAVVIPTLNSARFLAESVLSLRVGDARPMIFILDGGSTDGTQEIGRALKTLVIDLPGLHPTERIDEWMRMLINPHYDFLAIQHSDDIALPRRLEIQRDAFARDPSLGCVGGAMKPFWHEPDAQRFEGQGLVLPPREHEDIAAQLPFWWVMPAPALMFDLGKLRATGVPFANQFKFCNDWWHTWELAKSGLRFANPAEPVLCYRRHPGSDGPMNRAQVEAEGKEIRRDILGSMGVGATVGDLFCPGLIHLEGGPLWQGTPHQLPAARDWLLSLMRQTDDPALHNLCQRLHAQLGGNPPSAFPDL